MADDRRSKRAPNNPWKHIYGVDRKYTRRVDNAKERGQYTPPKESNDRTRTAKT